MNTEPSVLMVRRREEQRRLLAILGDHPFVAAAVITAASLATLVGVDPLPNALAYAAAQGVLVAIAAVDLAERRIPNLAVASLAAFAIACRTVSDPHRLAVAAILALVVLLVAGALSVWSQGGLGMGDAKLAAALGLLLGSSVFTALVVGTILGAVPGIVALGRRGFGARRETLAYGPYLVLGAVLTILLLDPPPLL